MSIKIKAISKFKDLSSRNSFFDSWVKQVQQISGTNYGRIDISTSLGQTVVWSVNANAQHLSTLVVFPGFRTSSLFWDLDNALEPLKKHFHIYLVETNGQPNLSDGSTPEIKSNGYGLWAREVLDALSIKQASIAGASFGGLVCLKLCIVAPERVQKVFLLNPGCLQSFSMSLKNLYYNLLPIISPTHKNVERFLDVAVFSKPHHTLSAESKSLLIDYEVFALKEYIDKTQKPYAMKQDELRQINSDIYLLVGDKDLLFPYQKSVEAARKYLKTLRATHILQNTGHGIETSRSAITIIADVMKNEAQASLQRG